MRKKLPFPRAICTVPCKIQWFTKERDEDTGIPCVCYEWKGFCAHRESKKMRSEKDRQYEEYISAAVFQGDITPLEPFSYGNITFYPDRKNGEIVKQRITEVVFGFNPDGTIHHTKVFLEESGD